MISKVVFIRPSTGSAKEVNEATSYPPLGLMYMASYLENKGIHCQIIDAEVLRLNNQQIIRKVENYCADLVCITSNIAYAKETNILAKKIKTIVKSYVVIGGPFATSVAKETLDNSEADCVVRGEGEIVLWHIIKNDMNLEKINGVSYLKNGNLVNNPREDLIADLDKLPIPAYHLIPDLNKYESRSREAPVAPLMTSRGCPYQCIYCNKNIFGSKFRKRSPENIISEIRMVVEKYKVKQIDIVDDTFTTDIIHAEKVLDLIIQEKFKVFITFPNGLRADTLTKNVVHKMKLAGVYKVGIGIETGDLEIMKTIKKNLDLNKVVQAIKWFREEGITVFGFFMLGLPGENAQTIKRTIEFAKKANPHIANFAITIPMPDTELYDIIKKEGKFIKDQKLGINKGYYSIDKGYYEFGDLKSTDLIKYQRKAYREFYFRPMKIIEFFYIIKSFRELKWTIKTALPLLKGIFK